MKSTLIFVCALTMSGLAIAAPDCMKVIKRINSDMHKTDVPGDAAYPWQNFSWFEQQFKTSPHKSKSEDQGTEFRWDCGKDSNNYVVATKNREGALIRVSGHISSDDGEILFSADVDPQLTKKQDVILETLPKKPVDAPPPIGPVPAQESPKPVSTQSTEMNNKPDLSSAAVTNNASKEANKSDLEYKPNVGSYTESEGGDDSADNNEHLSYIAKFKACTPGTYNRQRGTASITTVISGYKNNKCVVDATVKDSGETEVLKCQYSQASLDYFANDAQQLIKTGKPKTEAEITPAQRAVMQNALKECNSSWVPL